jgi:hypothetical protein
MKLSKEQMLYGGLAVLLLVIVVYSAKPLTLKEVEEDTNKNFDASKLPSQLKPPTRLIDGEPLPILNPPKRMNLSFSPRLDQ